MIYRSPPRAARTIYVDAEAFIRYWGKPWRNMRGVVRHHLHQRRADRRRAFDVVPGPRVRRPSGLEAHNSPGATGTATAGCSPTASRRHPGRADLRADRQHVADTGPGASERAPRSAEAREGGRPAADAIVVDLPPNSRTTVPMHARSPGLSGPALRRPGRKHRHSRRSRIWSSSARCTGTPEGVVWAAGNYNWLATPVPSDVRDDGRRQTPANGVCHGPLSRFGVACAVGAALGGRLLASRRAQQSPAPQPRPFNGLTTEPIRIRIQAWPRLPTARRVDMMRSIAIVALVWPSVLPACGRRW